MDTAAETLVDLRHARRRRRTSDIDVFEALYRSYLTAVLVSAAAIPVSRHRIGRIPAQALAVLVLAWSGLDLARHMPTSPLTFLGRLALWPLHVDLTAFLGVAVVLVVAPLAVAVVGGT